MPEWWEGFFEGLWQDVQLGMWTEEDNRAAADKIERAMGLQNPVRVLDVPCGDGRISLELAARGHDVTGVDITERFLAEAERKAQDRRLSIRWERRDMRDLPFQSEFDAALNFGGSFGYFNEEDNARVAAGICRALRPGGRFLIDMPTPETVFPRFREKFWLTAREVLVLAKNRYDHETRRIDADWTAVGRTGAASPATARSSCTRIGSSWPCCGPRASYVSTGSTRKISSRSPSARPAGCSWRRRDRLAAKPVIASRWQAHRAHGPADSTDRRNRRPQAEQPGSS